MPLRVGSFPDVHPRCRYPAVTAGLGTGHACGALCAEAVADTVKYVQWIGVGLCTVTAVRHSRAMTMPETMSGRVPLPGVVAPPHTRTEDAVGIATGAFLASMGLFALDAGGVTTGGTAGLALLVTHAASWSFHVAFLAVSLPFVALAVRRKGWGFTARSAVALALVSVFTALHPLALRVGSIDPVYAALVGNLLAGLGILVVFRHGASLGGFNVIALLCQERLGLRAGYVQLALDLVVIGVSFTVLPWPAVLLSAAGAVVLNVEIAMNHRPGRYLGE